jgi:hypothetical protein
MKRFFVLAVIVCLALISAACKSPSSSSPPEPIIKKANVVIDGDITKTMTSYDCPEFDGYVKNTGNNTAYNCEVEIKCYSDSNQTTIIDTADGFPSDLGDIEAGQRAIFKAIAFNCDSWDQIQSCSVKISWLDRSSGIEVQMEQVYNF